MLAMLAMLALALLPTVSHALALSRGGNAWAEVCTPQGMRLVAVDDSASDAAPTRTAGHLEHCALCALAGVAAAPPPAPAVVPLLPLASVEPPRLFLHAPRTLFALCTAQPRGPPTIS